MSNRDFVELSAGGLPDLSICDREPISIPGSIQPHGALIVLGRDGSTILQASANCGQWLGSGVEQLLGHPLTAIVPAAAAEAVARYLANPDNPSLPLYVATVRVRDQAFRLLAHQFQGVNILEFDPSDSFDPMEFSSLYPVVRSFVTSLSDSASVAEVCARAAQEVRRLTGFERVMVYQFDADWNGTVIAEDRGSLYESYLGLRFPASDIPAQARELYRTNRYRIIPDARYSPVPIQPPRHPETGEPLDLSHAILRSVSPIHCEYLHNMGVVASLSVSVVLNQRLWALIACHHPEPRTVSFEVHTALDLLAQLLAQQIGAQENSAEAQQRIRLKALETELLATMAAEGNFVDGLIARTVSTLSFADACGAAVVYDDRCTMIGDCPPEELVRHVSAGLADRGIDGVFASDERSGWWPAEVDPEEGSPAGLLAIRISRLHPSYLIWFRREVVQTVTWAGNPTKFPDHATGRVHPRRSFDQWKQVVRGRSLPWDGQLLQAAGDLRHAIVEIVLRKAEEQAVLAEELARSNKELEAFSYSVSHDLRAPFRHIVGYAELLGERSATKFDDTDRRFLATIIDSARFAGSLVDNLLSFSQMGRSVLNRVRADLNIVVREAIHSLTVSRQKPIEWVTEPLPVVCVDVLMLRLVFQNLLGNAIKFSAKQEKPCICISAQESASEHTIIVADNGIGFDMRYADKLFGVFQRLHRSEEYEGTGVGLANVQRIIQRHGGRTWAEGKLGVGATFYFTLPKTVE